MPTCNYVNNRITVFCTRAVAQRLPCSMLWRHRSVTLPRGLKALALDGPRQFLEILGLVLTVPRLISASYNSCLSRFRPRTSCLGLCLEFRAPERQIFRISTVDVLEGLWRMRRHGPVIAQCTDSVVFPLELPNDENVGNHVTEYAYCVTTTSAAKCPPVRSQDPLQSARQHPSYDDCLEVKREYYQNCCVLGCVTQCSQSAAHSYEQFLQVQQIGFVTLGPLRHA